MEPRGPCLASTRADQHARRAAPAGDGVDDPQKYVCFLIVVMKLPVITVRCCQVPKLGHGSNVRGGDSEGGGGGGVGGGKKKKKKKKRKETTTEGRSDDNTQAASCASHNVEPPLLPGPSLLPLATSIAAPRTSGRRQRQGALHPSRLDRSGRDAGGKHARQHEPRRKRKAPPRLCLCAPLKNNGCYSNGVGNSRCPQAK